MATVRIGCKLPNGLIMELIDPGKLVDPNPIGRRFILKGANAARASTKDNPLIADFSFTEVDEEFAKAWFERHKDAAFIKNGAVFMQAKPSDAKAEAKEKKQEPTGLEPLNPEKDKRTPRAVEVDKDQLKRLLGAAA